jgi:hypothetical protein
MEKAEMAIDTASSGSATINNKYARKGFYYVDAYTDLINEIEEVTSNSRGIYASDTKILPELQFRLYYHLYQRLHSYGGFEWNTNIFGINPNR